MLPERGSLVFTTSSSSSGSSSVSWDALSDIDSLFSLPRLTILRKDERLEASTSHSELRFPQGKLSLRSSFRRPVNLNRTRQHKYHSYNSDHHAVQYVQVWNATCLDWRCCKCDGTVKNSPIQRAQQVHNLAVKNKRGLHGSTCCVDNYITLQEISTLYGLLFETSQGNHGQCGVSADLS